MIDIEPSRIRKGLFRLLHAPSDVDRWDANVTWKGLSAVSAGHQDLFKRYCLELDPAVREAVQMWNGELNGWASEGNSPEQAQETMWATYPAGPAAHPPFVAFVRRYWLACDRLNQSVPESRAARPEQFMLGWLSEDSTFERHAAVLACMPYWPLGIDDEGRWI